MEIPRTPIRYKLDLSHPKAREIGVNMTVELPDSTLDLVMPHISPGSPTNSLNQDARIRNIEVNDGAGNALNYKQLKEGGFRIEKAAPGPVTVHYQVQADEFSHVRNSLTDDHVYLNGPAALMFVKGHDTDTPSTVELTHLPDPDWKAISSLARCKDYPAAFWASSYQDIADTNIFAGPLNSASETVGGTELTVNVHGTPPWDSLRVNGATAAESVRDLKSLYEVFTKNFGDFPLERRKDAAERPAGVEQNDKYVVNKHYFHNGPRSAGGYEHYHGHELLLHKSSEKGIEKKFDSDGRAFERGIMAHELMHKLLAKLVTHDGIDSEDLGHADRTDGLWVTEGVTDWSGNVLERQAGLISSDEYLHRLEGFYQRYAEDMAHDHTSPTDDSMNAHIGCGNYYNKGAVAASLLDLELRKYSGGKKGMFDVLRALKKEFGGTGHGHSLDDMERLSVVQVKDNPEGAARVKEFYQKHLRGREAFDINGSLAHVGYRMVPVQEPVEPVSLDLGGKTLAMDAQGQLRLLPIEGKDKSAFLPAFGMSLTRADTGMKVSGVRRDGPADEAGLSEYSGETASKVEYDQESGRLTLEFVKDDMFTGKPKSHTLTVDPEPATTLKLEAVENPTEEQLELRKAWQDGSVA